MTNAEFFWFVAGNVSGIAILTAHLLLFQWKRG